jgi:hypothetical protein
MLGKELKYRKSEYWSRQEPVFISLRDKPFGRGLLEAACVRCALVLKDLQSLRELWQDAAVAWQEEARDWPKGRRQYETDAA